MNEHDLGDLLVRLHDSIDDTTVRTPPTASHAIRRRARRLARRRRTVTAIVGSSVVVAIVAVAAINLADDDRRVTRLLPADPTTGTGSVPDPVSSDPTASTDPVSSGATTSPDPTASPGSTVATSAPAIPLSPAVHDWQALPAVPLAARSAAAVVTVGDQLIVWGGGVPNHLDGSEPPFADGAVLDIAAGRWRPMAASPLAGGSSAGAALDGQATFVDATGASARYDPTTDTWTQIPGSATPLNQIVVWDGRLVGTSGSGFAQLGPDGWSAMSAPDVHVQDAQLVVVGDELMMFGASPDPTLVGYRHVDGRWSALPTAPSIDVSGGMVGVGAVDGRVVAVGWAMQATVYDPLTGTWSPLPDLPGLATKCQPKVAGIGTTTVARMCGFVAVLPDDSSSWAISSPFAGRIDLGLHIDTDRIIAGGSSTTGDPAGQLLTPIVMGMVTVDPSASPTGFSSGGGSSPADLIDTTVSAHLSSTGCDLTVGAEAIDQRTMADATRAAAVDPAPESLTWGGSAGSATLRCGSGDAYRQALATLQTAGERTVPVDATADILALGGAPAASPEALIEAIWPALQQLNADAEIPLQVAVSWDPDGVPIATIELIGFPDDSVHGVAYAIVGRSTAAGWVVDSATVASICRRGVAADTDEQLCI